MTKSPPPVILFDGTCVLCNRFFQFILRRDKAQKFKFGVLQDPSILNLLEKYSSKEITEIKQGLYRTVILIDDHKMYTESTAAIRILVHLKGAYQSARLLYIIPPFIRNPVYRLIAKTRYQVFGKQQCFLPDEKLKSRFISPLA